MFGFVIIYWWCHGLRILRGVTSGFVNGLWVSFFSGFIGGVVGGLKMISLAILFVVL